MLQPSPLITEVDLRIRAVISEWNGLGDIAKLKARFRIDAVLSSPSARDDNGLPIDWIQGRDLIMHHLRDFRRDHPTLTIRNIFLGRQFYSVLLDDHESYMVHVEPDQEDGLIRRMIICRSAQDKSWQ